MNTTTSNEAETVTFEAIFDIDRFAGGKRFQGSWLLLDDGRRLVASYRPIEEHLDKVGRRVVVSGQHYTNPPHVQHIDADHFRISDMKLASGQTPAEHAPGHIPPAPNLDSWQEAQTFEQRWVQVQGLLLDVSRGDWHHNITVDVKGARVAVYLSNHFVQNDLEGKISPLDAHIGARLTVVGRVITDEKSGELMLGGTTWVCAGHVTVCGEQVVP